MSGEETSESANTPEVWTVKKVLDWTIGHLKQHGSESARLDAEILLAHSRSCRRIQLYTEYDAPLSPEERATMRDLVRRRAAHEPVAYLVGFREFFGVEFEVEPGVLIPRPDTETLVMTALEVAKDIPSPRILDVCTGTACVPVAIAENFANAVLTAIELGDQAHQVARRNIDKHGLADRITLLQGDLFSPLASDASFDIITANPPYVTNEEMNTLPPDIRLHEPELALRGGADGLDIVRRLILEAAARLTDAGTLLLEIGSQQGDDVCRLFATTNQYEPAQAVKDLGGCTRVVWAKKKLTN
ncbi:MAG: peptide chain release factor N(5)-glutamine methyltransferase [Planctomycetota bacterium]|nr:peptide chain release factor N(5)-glutamine methyltransferase [Planctomycetota bacterium]MDA0920606.1 peptide chain release factor N(5)-glutamine methyltransferase [Planctomycetota bacterium]